MELLGLLTRKESPLDDFYRSVVERWDKRWADGASAMQILIARLRELPSPDRAYAQTSHARLCLLSNDASDSPWLLIISALDEHHYVIEYLMPGHLAPWPGAYVRGEARSIDEAFKMILIGMERSGGWK